MNNWVPSLEEMASDPGYVDAPAIGIQADDFDMVTNSIAEPFVAKGMGVQPIVYNVEASDVPGYVDPDPFAKAYDGQIVTLVNKWPTELPIPEGGDVIAQDMDEATVQQISSEGYNVFVSAEAYVAQLDPSKLLSYKAILGRMAT